MGAGPWVASSVAPHVRPAERKLDVAALGELAVAGIAIDLQDPLEGVEMAWKAR
jgi:hypothetical protein